MKYNSEIKEVLDLKPVLNKRNHSIFFYKNQEEDKKFINDVLELEIEKNIWTWSIPNGLDTLSNGYWLVDQNAYVITKYPYTENTDFSFRILPSDFIIIKDYEKGAIHERI